ncbi:MAG: GerMN domain-containing protein [Thermodesulfobacteriota bacterium]
MAGKKIKKRGKRHKKPVKKKGRARGGALLKTILLIAALVSISFAVLFLLPVKRGEYPPPPQRTVLREVRIYTLSEDGKHLKGKKAKINKGPLASEVKGAIGLLIKNQEKSAIPSGTRLMGLKIKGGTAYVNLSVEASKNHGGGTMGELLTIYSIVDTVTLNFPEIKEIQILIDGRIQKTLKGHIDISFPLKANRKIIKG